MANPDNHYWRALYAFKPGQRYAFPGFADDQQYRYYFGIARHGGTIPEPLAFKLIYDAYTEPLLYRAYCDDAPVPPGINRFDLHPYYAQDGKPTDYRSDRKGPGGQPRPIGSRMGPQNMACCGVALQALKAYPKIWEKRCKGDWASINDWCPEFGERDDPYSKRHFLKEDRNRFVGVSCIATPSRCLDSV